MKISTLLGLCLFTLGFFFVEKGHCAGLVGHF